MRIAYLKIHLAALALCACSSQTKQARSAPPGSTGAPDDSGADKADSQIEDGGKLGDAGVNGTDAGRSDAAPGDSGNTDSGNASSDHWRPAPGTSWQWQLSGSLDTSVDVKMYDIDLFNSSAADIASLHAAGRRVVCYFDTAYEPYRPDHTRLQPYRGKVIDGWADQNWLDIRAPQVVAVMKERIAMAAQKGCDGIEADDVDVADNDTGFPLTRNDQRMFIRTLAAEAHAHGLAYGLKNCLAEITELLNDVDFAVNEQCLEFDECDTMKPLIAAGKAVFHVEHADDGSSLAARGQSVCPPARALGFDTLVKYLDLDARRYACP